MLTIKLLQNVDEFYNTVILQDSNAEWKEATIFFHIPTCYSNLRRFTRGRHRCRRVLSSAIAFVRPSVRPERRYRSNALRISCINLKFGGMMQSNMKQIAIQIGHDQPIF